MNDDTTETQTEPEPETTVEPDADDLGAADDAPADGGVLDKYDDAVMAADDTGMLAGESSITAAQIEAGLEEG